uniref:cyclin-dependent kinase 2-interacting protein n=1 Tax=Solea senegalensis TaxID=28829 RepID=UPI001CD88882|nr:cyclin-dependent kinase 2-interacting protein [Solea senegalensis]
MEGESRDVTSFNRKCSAVTGSARKIRDNMADWHNLMLKWDKLNEDGFSVASNVVNLRLSQSSQLSSSSAPPGGAAELQDQCCKLQHIFDKMVTMVGVVTRMENLMTSQRGLRDLEEFQFGPEGRQCPLFHTWDTKEFVGACHFLWESFVQEVKLKQIILQEVAHTISADLCAVYLSCWLHQPFNPAHNRHMLEALLLETGHRPL